MLRERELIERTRAIFEGPQAQGLPALHFAGIILKGAIIAYDADETTGGAGARYLGIGGQAEHRRDVVTVALRAVSVQSGRVLASVTTTKTVFSTLDEGRRLPLRRRSATSSRPRSASRGTSRARSRCARRSSWPS